MRATAACSATTRRCEQQAAAAECVEGRAAQRQQQTASGAAAYARRGSELCAAPAHGHTQQWQGSTGQRCPKASYPMFVARLCACALCSRRLGAGSRLRCCSLPLTMLCLRVPPLHSASTQVVEIAPAPSLAQGIKDALYADAVKLAKHVGYRNAGQQPGGCTLRTSTQQQARHLQYKDAAGQSSGAAELAPALAAAMDAGGWCRGMQRQVGLGLLDGLLF